MNLGEGFRSLVMPVLLAERAGFQQRFDQLLDKERIPVRFPGNQPSQLRRQLGPGQGLAGQLQTFLVVQLLQHQARDIGAFRKWIGIAGPIIQQH